MDMVFKRYSCPFSLFNSLIHTSSFSSFIDDLIETMNEEQIYEVWLYKVIDREFVDFKEEAMKQLESVRQAQIVPKNRPENVFKDAMNVLNTIKPERG